MAERWSEVADATRAVHAGQDPDPATGAVVPPLHLASTFAQDAVGEPRAGYEYARSANPTRAGFEQSVAALESPTAPAVGLGFASGLAASDTLLRTVLRPGDHVVLGDDVYGGTYRLLSTSYRRWGVELDQVDLSSVEAVAAALRPGSTRLVWVETPSNPTLSIADIRAIAEAAHAVGALVVVDNTFATPVLQKPLALGADVVLHSATKYLAGHSDVLLGAVVTAATDDGRALRARLAEHRLLHGAVAGPMETWLALRGMRTLAVRLERASANAAELARRLSEHPSLQEVRYPGSGAMLAVVLESAEAAELLTHATHLWVHATSLGGVESTLERRRRWKAEAATIPDGLVRLSVGVEDVEDLWDDLRAALDACVG